MTDQKQEYRAYKDKETGRYHVSLWSYNRSSGWYFDSFTKTVKSKPRPKNDIPIVFTNAS